MSAALTAHDTQAMMLGHETHDPTQLGRSMSNSKAPGDASAVRLISLPPSGWDGRADVPTTLTSLIGRQRELAALTMLLRRRNVRLLTLIGPGGVGKTRLALAVASKVVDAFSDGVIFIPLAHVREPSMVAPTVAQPLGVPECGGRSMVEGLKGYLRERRLLLVLDNFEQITAAAPLLTDLLLACPRLAILVTSRARLHLSGERDIVVPPLAVPASDPANARRPPPSRRLVTVPAVRLFIERAKAVNTDFELSASDTVAVAEICRRLDGLPLAIELAAPWTTVLTPPALLARLGLRLPLLTTGAHDLPARLQTMRNEIGWSYDLLTPEEQTLFRRLAVFNSGFTLDAAEAVCQGKAAPARSGDGGLEVTSAWPCLLSDPSVLHGISSLVEKSLLQHVPQRPGDARYVMLETIREYGLEQLAARGETPTAQDRHLAWCLGLAARAEEDLLAGRNEARWLDALDAELPNVRAALARLTETGDVETELRLAGGLARFWQMRAHQREGRQWLEGALARADEVPAAPRAKALTELAMLVMFQGETERAAAAAAEGLGLALDAGDVHGIAFARLAQGFLALLRGDFALARVRGTESRTLYGSDALGWNPFGADFCVARAVHYQGDLARADGLYKRLVADARANGMAYGLAVVLHSRGMLAQERGDHRRALPLYAKALIGFRALREPSQVAACLEGIAAAFASEQPERAARLFGAVERLRIDIGMPMVASDRTGYERAVATARNALGETAFVAAWNAGVAGALEELIAEAARLAAVSAPASERAERGAGEVSTISRLTRREREVLQHLVEGRSDREIGEILSISPRTVESHVTGILTKLDLSTRTAAAIYAVRHRVV